MPTPLASFGAVSVISLHATRVLLVNDIEFGPEYPHE
jgi:hypothetical protein